MKTFIYTYMEHTPKREGAVRKSVRIYRVRGNKPTLVAAGEDTYVSEFQLVLQVMEAAKLLPRKAFAKTAFGGYEHCYPTSMLADGIAAIYKVR